MLFCLQELLRDLDEPCKQSLTAMEPGSEILGIVGNAAWPSPFKVRAFYSNLSPVYDWIPREKRKEARLPTTKYLLSFKHFSFYIYLMGGLGEAHAMAQV